MPTPPHADPRVRAWAGIRRAAAALACLLSPILAGNLPYRGPQ